MAPVILPDGVPAGHAVLEAMSTDVAAQAV